MKGSAARRPSPGKATSSGVLVTDGTHLLLGHATASARWDIPNGLVEPGETPAAAARRELAEETGLVAPGELEALGQFTYLPRKDLVLFAWVTTAMPDPAKLACRSTFLLRGRAVPEFDRFDCPPWSEALGRVGKAMAKLLAAVGGTRGWVPGDARPGLVDQPRIS